MLVVKYIAIGLMIVACAVILSVCADALGVCCEHACCAGMDRSRPLTRFVRRMRLLCRASMSLVLLLVSGIFRTWAPPAFAPSASFLKVAALRI